MARRAGKAASRKARQRYQPRTPRPTPAPAPEEATTSTGGAEASRTITTPEPPRRSPAPVAYASGGSTLSARERAEYHYVERDLRNIGILTLVMLVVLVTAWFVFNSLGLV